MNVGIYARISDDTDNTRLGVKRQEKDCRSLAQLRDWEVSMTYVDNDVSAFKAKVVRPEFERMLIDLSNGLIDGVVTYDLDRFARQPTDLERAIKIYDSKSGLVFATVQGDIELSNPDGRTMARIMVAFANKASMDTSRRIKRKNLERARAGELRSANRPFGYEDDRITVCDREAKLIREAASDVLNGISMHSIARRWNGEGVTTSTGGPWRQSTVRRLLVSPRIAGYQIHQGVIALDEEGERVLANRAPILDKSTWETLVAFITNPDRTRPTSHPAGRKHLLSGLLRCGRCGTSMTADKDWRRKTHTYVCKPATSNGGCGGVGVSGPKVDELVTALVLDYLSNRKVVKQVEPWSGEAELEELDRRRRELMAEYTAARLSSDIVFPAVTQIEQRANAMRVEQAAWLRSQMSQVNKPAEVADSWPDLSIEARRAIVGRVLSHVVINPVGLKGGRFNPLRVEIVWND